MGRGRLPPVREGQKDSRSSTSSSSAAGSAGLTAGYLLKKAGKTVCLLERDRLGSGDTGRTTAHLTAVTDRRISTLINSFGKETAGLVWEAGEASINTIEAIVGEEGIDCEFRRVPGYLHASLTGPGDESRDLSSEADAARGLGIDAVYVPQVPRLGVPGVRYSNQAKFHPLRYLQGLARALRGDGSEIHEESEVSEVEAKPLAVKVGDVRVECDYLVIATHVPLMGIAGLVGAALFQAKLIPYSSYAISARIPRGDFPEASFWDTSNPYYYLRIDRARDHDRAIFGGEDHKTGQADDTAARFKRLEGLLKQLSPKAKIENRWSGQVIETIDGLPFIGETAENQFVATGFAGNGMTFGTLAGMMACDRALGRENPWHIVFDVNRKKIRDGAWKFLKENLDYPYYLLRDRFKSAEAPRHGPSSGARGRSSRSTGNAWPVREMERESSIRCQPSALTWDAWFTGTRLRRRGTALATVPDSGGRAKSSRDLPNRLSSRWRRKRPRTLKNRVVTRRRRRLTAETENGRIVVRPPQKQVDDQAGGDLAERDPVSAIPNRKVFALTSGRVPI